MKESLQRIGAWAREHPLLAGLIVLGVLIAAYLTYRSMQNSGPQQQPQAATDTQPQPQNASIPIDTGGGGAIGAGSTPVASASPGFSTIGTGGSGGRAHPSGSGGGGISIGATTSGGEVSFPSGSLGLNSSGIPDVLPSPPTYDAGALVNSASGLGVANAGVHDTGRTGAPRPETHYRPPQTPAEKVGKGPHFTGYYQGVQYVNGYPVNFAGAVSNYYQANPGGYVNPQIVTPAGQSLKY